MNEVSPKICRRSVYISFQLATRRHLSETRLRRVSEVYENRSGRLQRLFCFRRVYLLRGLTLAPSVVAIEAKSEARSRDLRLVFREIPMERTGRFEIRRPPRDRSSRAGSTPVEYPSQSKRQRRILLRNIIVERAPGVARILTAPSGADANDGGLASGR